MANVLFIVSRAEPGLHQYVQFAFAGVRNVEIILDRRRGQRRRRAEAVVTDRRVGERRVRDITRSLQQLGWAVVNPQSARARETARSS